MPIDSSQYGALPNIVITTVGSVFSSKAVAANTSTTLFSSVTLNVGDALILSVGFSAGTAFGIPTGFTWANKGGLLAPTEPNIYSTDWVANGGSATASIATQSNASSNIVATLYRITGLRTPVALLANGSGTATSTTPLATASAAESGLFAVIGSVIISGPSGDTAGSLNGTCTGNNQRGGTTGGTATTNSTINSASSVQTNASALTATMSITGMTSRTWGANVVVFDCTPWIPATYVGQSVRRAATY